MLRRDGGQAVRQQVIAAVAGLTSTRSPCLPRCGTSSVSTELHAAVLALENLIALSCWHRMILIVHAATEICAVG